MTTIILAQQNCKAHIHVNTDYRQWKLFTLKGHTKVKSFY